MKWNEEFIREKLPTDPIEAGKAICEWMSDGYDGDDWYEDLLDDFAFLQIWIRKHHWNIEIPSIDIEDRTGTVDTINNWVKTLRAYFMNKSASNALQTSLEYYQAELGVGFAYQLTDGDLDRIQKLVNQLRTQISSCGVLENDHRRRLLSRLEKLQRELHKRMSDYDRAYGIMVDGIILTQRFGEAVKPVTELIREIGNLFWRAQSRCEELPGDSPLPLPSSPSDKDCM